MIYFLSNATENNFSDYEDCVIPMKWQSLVTRGNNLSQGRSGEKETKLFLKNDP